MKLKKLRILALLGAVLTTGALHAQLALDLAAANNYTETAYVLNESAFTVEYDMYLHTLQDYNGGVTFTCGASPAPFDFYVNASGLITAVTGNCVVNSFATPDILVAGTWYNIAYVYEYDAANPPDQYVDIYINGFLMNTQLIDPYNPLVSNGNFRIGDRTDNGTNANAKFDNVRIWSTARTESQVLQDMTTCYSGYEPGLDILYTMEEGTGNTLSDLALGNGAQNATIVGLHTWSSGVTINPISQGAIKNLSACETYTSPSGNYTWTASGTYTDTLSTSSGCDSVVTINLLINSASGATAMISNDVLCLGESTQLGLSSDVVSEFYVGNPTSQSTNDVSSYPCVYGNDFEGAKHQILVLASELSAMGMQPGEISGIEFYIASMNNSTDSLLNLTIRMAHTSAASMVSTFEVPTFVTTFSSSIYGITVGTLSHDFTTPFIWDGTSNLLIETCYNNNLSAATSETTENLSMLYTTTPFQSVTFAINLNDDQLCASTFGSYSFKRPNFKLLGTTANSIQWTNATGGIADPTSASTSATPTASGQYLLSLSNSLSGCSNQSSVAVTVNQNPTVNLGADISQVNPPVTLDAGAGFTTYDWSSGQTTQTISVTSSGTYIATVTNANGCAGSDTILVEFTAGIENLDGSIAQIRLYPNPTSDFLNMELIGYTGELLTIELIDLNGKLVKSFEMKNIMENTNTQLDMNNVLDGIYLITITTPTSTSSHRIVVNH